MRPYHLTALFILLYWQLGPLPQRTTDSTGQVRWSLSAMAGKGQWEDATFDCDGNLVSTVADEYRDIGGRADVEFLPSNLRITASGGVAYRTEDFGAGPVDVSVGTYAALVAWEPPPLGVGIGIARDELGEMLPSSYLRIGPRDRAHFLFETAPPVETRQMSGVVRMGVGFKTGTIGLAFGPRTEKFSQAVLFGDLRVPVTRGIDLRLGVQGGPGLQVSQWGLAAGVRIHN